jgi:hypothetical protein
VIDGIGRAILIVVNPLKYHDRSTNTNRKVQIRNKKNVELAMKQNEGKEKKLSSNQTREGVGGTERGVKGFLGKERA